MIPVAGIRVGMVSSSLCRPLALCLAVALMLVVACGSPRIPPPAPPSGYAGGPLVVTENLVIPSLPHQVVHEVAPLETVWRLSKMYGVPVEAIRRANHLGADYAITIGQKLVIPKARALSNVINLYPNRCWKYIIIHHTATEIGNATLIHRAHHDRGFWNGLGYHFLIDNGSLGKGDGQIEMAPRWIKQQPGAHCRADGMNRRGIGIALVGNFDIEQPTENQIQSLARLIDTLCRYYHIPRSHLLGHGQVPGANTDCPGTHFPWARLNRLLNGQ